MSYLPLRIQSIRQETTDVKTFVLQPGDGRLFYKPGQFVTFIFNRGSKEIRRSYSFSSNPNLNEPPSISIKRIDNGEISRWFFDHAKAGGELQTIGASGFFTFPENLKEFNQLIFLAAGSGITPVFSLIKEALHFHPHTQVVLLYSNRSKEKTIFYSELENLKAEFVDRFKIGYFFSNNQNLKRARLGKPALEDWLRDHIINPIQTVSFLCGPYAYMQMATISLLNNGIAQENIRKEIFHTPLPAAPLRPPDTEPHQVDIRHEGKFYSVSVQYPQTILKAAREQGILLPFSCEAGRCGTCAATCTKGEVWMSRNEVLLDKEMAKGRVLTCTGFPIGGDTAFEFNL